MTNCKCETTTRIGDGDQAMRYAIDHLTPMRHKSGGWESLFVCPQTGIYWKMYYVQKNTKIEIPELIRISREEARKQFTDAERSKNNYGWYHNDPLEPGSPLDVG